MNKDLRPGRKGPPTGFGHGRRHSCLGYVSVLPACLQRLYWWEGGFTLRGTVTCSKPGVTARLFLKRHTVHSVFHIPLTSQGSPQSCYRFVTVCFICNALFLINFRQEIFENLLSWYTNTSTVCSSHTEWCFWVRINKIPLMTFYFHKLWLLHHLLCLCSQQTLLIPLVKFLKLLIHYFHSCKSFIIVYHAFPLFL